MAILDLQRRIAEAGRIRLGVQVPTGNGRTRPAKLETFRLTSADKLRIEQAAAMWGGNVEQWDAPAGRQWQVITEATSLDVIVPPADMAFSMSYELWSAGGCQRRCDGRTESISESTCLCDPDRRECDIHTRLSVMLRDLPGLGVWRVDTQGWYAATELSGAVEVIQIAAGRGQLLPARLLLAQRQVKRTDQDGKAVTRKFAVPVLDVDITPGQLVAAPGTGPLALPAPTDLPGPAADNTFGLKASGVGEPVDGRAALDRAVPLTPVPPSVQHRPAGTVADQLRKSTEPQEKPRRKNSAQPVPSTGVEPRTAAQAAADLSSLGEDGSLPAGARVSGGQPGGRAAGSAVPPDAGPVREHLPGPDRKAGLQAAADFVNELAEVTEHRGRHEGHTLEKVGRCVYCSCGFRYQGDLPKPQAEVDGPGNVTAQQIRALHAGLTAHGFNGQKERDTLLQIVEILAGRELTGPYQAIGGNPRTTKNLTRAEASKVIDHLKSCDSQAAVWELVGQLDGEPVQGELVEDP